MCQQKSISTKAAVWTTTSTLTFSSCNSRWSQLVRYRCSIHEVFSNKLSVYHLIRLEPIEKKKVSVRSCRRLVAAPVRNLSCHGGDDVKRRRGWREGSWQADGKPCAGVVMVIVQTRCWKVSGNVFCFFFWLLLHPLQLFKTPQSSLSWGFSTNSMRFIIISALFVLLNPFFRMWQLEVLLVIIIKCYFLCFFFQKSYICNKLYSADGCTHSSGTHLWLVHSNHHFNVSRMQQI